MFSTAGIHGRRRELKAERELSQYLVAVLVSVILHMITKRFCKFSFKNTFPVLLCLGDKL